MTTERKSPAMEPPPTTESLPQNVRLLGWASLLNDIASEAVYPLLPHFLLGLGGSRTLLGLLEGLADTVASLLKLWTGAWSDRLGQRKIFIVIGYALAGLSRPCLGLATQISQVFGIRLLDRIGKGIRTAPRDALIRTRTRPVRPLSFARATSSESEALAILEPLQPTDLGAEASILRGATATGTSYALNRYLTE